MQSLHNVHVHNLFSYLERGGQKNKILSYCHIVILSYCRLTDCPALCAADRAKAIKTQAIINESPTDKLIRELREENLKLMEMLKTGKLSEPSDGPPQGETQSDLSCGAIRTKHR